MTGAPLHDVLAVLVRAIERYTADGMLASILLVDNGVLRHGAAPNLPDGYNQRVDGLAIGPSQGSCGTAAHTGAPVAVADIANDPLWASYTDLARDYGLAACWSMPIHATGGEIIGTFAHYYRTPRDPTPHDRAAVEWIADTAGLVIERDREARQRREAEEQLRRQVEGLQLVHDLAIGLHAPSELGPTFEVALDVAIRLHEARAGALLVYQGERLEVVASRGFDDVPPALLATLVRDVERRDGERVIVEDTETDPQYVELVPLARLMKFRAVHRTPIHKRNGVPVGVLIVHLAAQRAPTSLEIQLSDLCARHVADAVERAQALAESRDARAAAEQANRAKDEFLAILGHELRNPLAPIATALQLWEMRVKDESLQPLRDVIERQLAHLTRIVDDLQDVARIRQGKIQLDRQPLDVRGVLVRAIEMTAPQFAQRHQTVTLDAPAGLMVEGDATRLAQVVTNLLVNAAKYSDAETTTTVTARRIDTTIEIAVRDQGIGLEPQMLAHVFDLFTQEERALDRSHGGLGIGLAIVRKLVTLHGGSVHAHSDGIGRGCTFTVTLPALVATDDAPVAPRKRAARTERARKILVVDDNTDVADMMAELLTNMGHDVRIANDGAAALAAATAFTPEIALLDLGLPVMDGYEIARRLRVEGTTRPFLVAVTGYGQASDQARAHEAGFDAHLVKPVSLDTVLRVIVGVPPTSS
jgi:signal transduction histidine kinase